MADQPDVNPYLRQAILTATPEQLQLMLYDGAIRFATEGRDALEHNDYEQAFNKLTRAQKIMLEMYNGLNHEVNPELCDRVGALYMFVYHKLIDGNAHHDRSAIDDALKILRLERETWQMVVDKVARERGDTDRDESPVAVEPGGLSVEG